MNAEELKNLVENIEVLINRHSPLENFDVREDCARDIAGYFSDLLKKRDEALAERIKNSPKTFGITDSEGRGGAMLVEDILTEISSDNKD